MGGGIEVRPRWSVAILEQTFRDEWGRVLAALIGLSRDFELAEEAAQGRLRSQQSWPRDGAPDPAAWLLTTARNASNRIRRTARWPVRRACLGVPEALEDTMNTNHVSRRTTRASIHLLSSGARRRGTGRSDAAKRSAVSPPQ